MISSLYLYLDTLFVMIVFLYVQKAYYTLSLCKRYKAPTSHIKQWFFFEIGCFILNIISMSIFLLISWIKSYRTIRERVGLAFEYGVFCRKEDDYFNYCLGDISYFTNWFVTCTLNITVIYVRY